ncbi:MAG: phage tail tube protein [Tistlia sp.]|uniref:phage tail tube protein n=1 Tax=Tistlia sp. TaxID=3057121 RepID=UPI0034A2BE96
MSNRRGGIIYFAIDGTQYDAKGNFTYNLGAGKREAIVGADAVHGYKETPQVARIEGEITDSSELALSALIALDGVTVTLELANGKVVVLREAWYAADGDGQTEEGNLQVLFHGKSAEEVR